jgi:tetratricopeptide (TPR) repeat protein
LSRRNATSHWRLAHCLHATGHRQEAVERYLEVAEIDSDFGEAWNNLGIVLCEVGRRETAATAFRRALAADPHDARVHFNLADTLDELKFLPEAVEHWRAYLRYDSTRAHARGRLATC